MTTDRVHVSHVSEESAPVPVRPFPPFPQFGLDRPDQALSEALTAYRDARGAQLREDSDATWAARVLAATALAEAAELVTNVHRAIDLRRGGRP